MENQAPELLTPSADMLAAFSQAQPVAAQPVAPLETPAPEQPVSTPAPAAAVESGTNTPAPAATPAPEPVVAATPDYNAYLKETFQAEPETIKQALAAATKVAELEKQVADTAVIRELLSDPVKAREFVDLTNQDFGKLATEDPKAVLFAQYKAQNPQYNGQAAQIRFEREFNAKYPGYSYDDTESEAHREDALLVSEDAATAAQFMQGKQAEARKQLEAPEVAAAPEGPTAEELEAQAAASLQQIEGFLKDFDGFDYTVEGQTVSAGLSDSDAFKSFLLNPADAFKALVLDEKGNLDLDKLAQVAFKLTQDVPGAIAKGVKGSAGPVVPMQQLTNNPAAGAPQTSNPGDRAGMIAAIAQAARPSADLNY